MSHSEGKNHPESRRLEKTTKIRLKNCFLGRFSTRKIDFEKKNGINGIR